MMDIPMWRGVAGVAGTNGAGGPGPARAPPTTCLTSVASALRLPCWLAGPAGPPQPSQGSLGLLHHLVWQALFLCRAEAAWVNVPQPTGDWCVCIVQRCCVCVCSLHEVTTFGHCPSQLTRRRMLAAPAYVHLRNRVMSSALRAPQPATASSRWPHSTAHQDAASGRMSRHLVAASCGKMLVLIHARCSSCCPSSMLAHRKPSCHDVKP